MLLDYFQQIIHHLLFQANSTIYTMQYIIQNSILHYHIHNLNLLVIVLDPFELRIFFTNIALCGIKLIPITFFAILRFLR